MKRSEALSKLEEFCKDLTPSDPKNSARYILEFVEEELEMKKINRCSLGWELEDAKET